MQKIKGVFQDIPLKKIKKAKWNYKDDDPDLRKKLTAQIAKNGQLENLIVRELGNNFEAINGNHRIDSFTDLDYKMVHCVNVGKVSMSTAKRIAIETNETKFPANKRKLSVTMQTLVIDYEPVELVTTMPYTQEKINEIVEFVNLEDHKISRQKNDIKTSSKTVTFILDEDARKKFETLKAFRPDLKHNELFVYMMKTTIQKEKSNS